MEKSINIVIEETKQNLANVINNSGLPMGIIELIINDIQSQVINAKNNQLSQEIEEYNKKITESQKKEKENKNKVEKEK